MIDVNFLDRAWGGEALEDLSAAADRKANVPQTTLVPTPSSVTDDERENVQAEMVYIRPPQSGRPR